MQSNYDAKTGGIEYKEKGVDVQLASNLITFHNRYDVAVLMSADGDYVPAVKAAQGLGKRIENAFPWQRKSWHLYQVCALGSGTCAGLIGATSKRRDKNRHCFSWALKYNGGMAKKKNPAAVALGRLGGLKGGKARAAKLSPTQRSEIARNAVLARWEKRKKGIA